MKKYEIHELPHEVSSLIRLAKEQDWEYSKASSGHHRLVSPQGRIVMHSGTPSDRRAILNFRAELKRHGLRPYTPLKEDKPLSEPKLVISKVAGDSTAPITPVGGKVKKKRNVAPGVRGGVKETIIKTLREKDVPEGVSSQEIRDAVRKTLPSVAGNISSSLTYYTEQGLLRKVSHGRYRLASISEISTTEEDDSKILDEAISVLAKLEGVVRRMREKEKKIEEAKAALAAIK